jgi:hypothetical protein
VAIGTKFLKLIAHSRFLNCGRIIGAHMGLIIERVLYEGIASPPEGAENVYLNVQKQYLSRYYDLPIDTSVASIL